MVDKEIDRIEKNPETDIVIRIDEFNGRTGVTIREFVKSERYTGFTKAGTRIPADKFHLFKKAINSIDEKDLESNTESPKAPNINTGPAHHSEKPKTQKKPTTEEELEF